MTIATQLALVLSILLPGLCVHLVAMPRAPRRLFLTDLGRDLTSEDRARARRVLAINAGFVLVGIAGVLSVGIAAAGLAFAILCPLIPVMALIVESIAVGRTMKEAPASAVDGEELIGAPKFWDYLSVPLQTLNVVVIATGIAVFAGLLERLPEKVPVHWNLAGDIDRWASPSTHWGLLGILIFMTLLMWVVLGMIARERWVLPATERERYIGLQHRRRIQMARLMEWMILGINVGFVLMWLLIAASGLPGQASLASGGIVAMLVVMGISILGPFIVYLPRMMTIAQGIREIAGSDVLGTLDDGWRWGGLIYYAPEDRAVVVPKKIGIGQTFNMARPAAWLFLAVVVGMPLALTVILAVFVD